MSDWRIQPLEKSHDRSGFDCGVDALNHYLKNQASQDLKRKVCAVYAASPADTQEVEGYYTLSAATAHLASLPEAVRKRLPRYPDVPAFLIGRLAVSSASQGSGLGRILLMNALLNCLRLSDEVGAALVLVDAKDEKAMRFYQKFQFEPLSRNRLFLPLAVIAKLTG